MFISEKSRSIDQKRRLAIPADFRRKLGKGAVITRGIDNCLVLFPFDQWKKEAEKLQNLSTTKREARGYARLRFSGAANVKFDKLGRILVPEYLKKYARLKKNAVVIGMGNRIEIWDEKMWRDYSNKIENQMDSIVEELGEFGI